MNNPALHELLTEFLGVIIEPPTYLLVLLPTYTKIGRQIKISWAQIFVESYYTPTLENLIKSNWDSI